MRKNEQTLWAHISPQVVGTNRLNAANQSRNNPDHVDLDDCNKGAGEKPVQKKIKLSLLEFIKIKSKLELLRFYLQFLLTIFFPHFNP